jgi:hypothetical protein
MEDQQFWSVVFLWVIQFMAIGAVAWWGWRSADEDDEE